MRGKAKKLAHPNTLIGGFAGVILVPPRAIRFSKRERRGSWLTLM
jgi:hypothetical protein